MTIGEKRVWRFLIVAFIVLLAVSAANALIDVGAVIHDLTHSH